MKTVVNIFVLMFSMIFFSGCNQNTVVIPKEQSSTSMIHYTADDAIIAIANQLSANNKLSKVDTGTLTVVSFVDLEQFNKTSRFGMVLAESLFNELFIRGFNVSDIRGQNAININATGEFYITRNVSKLNSEVSNTYIVLGTYTKVDQNVMINARIIDNKTGKLISSARAMYANDDCSIYGVCNNASRKIKLVGNNVNNNNDTNKNSVSKHTPMPRKIVF